MLPSTVLICFTVGIRLSTCTKSNAYSLDRASTRIAEASCCRKSSSTSWNQKTVPMILEKIRTSKLLHNRHQLPASIVLNHSSYFLYRISSFPVIKIGVPCLYPASRLFLSSIKDAISILPKVISSSKRKMT